MDVRTKCVFLLLLFSAPSTCQDFSNLSQLWEQLSSSQPVSSPEGSLNLIALVNAALANVEQEAASAPNDFSIENCAADLGILGEAIQPVKMIGNGVMNLSGLALALDAAGKVPAGLLQSLGASSFRGNMEECQMITVPMNHSSEMYYGSLTLTLSSIATHRPLFPPFREELCLPSSCNLSAIELVLAELNKTLNSIGLYIDPATTTYTAYSMKGQPLSSGAIVMIFVCSAILLLVFISTVVDKVWPAWIEIRRQQKFQLKSKSLQEAEANLPEVEPKLPEYKPLLGNAKRASCNKRLEQFLYEIVTAFSLYKNIPLILATHQPPSAITSINGVRVISMFWVIMGHVYTFTIQIFPITRNLMYVGLTVLPRFASQVIVNGFLSVDSFFFLSGVLVSYLTLREMKRRKGRFPLVSYYLHRIFRLTPTYMFLLFFFWVFPVYLNQGTPTIQSIAVPQQENCQNYWWTNLLYINNFYPWKLERECMSWSWYLANDMQFFVISPLIIIPLFVWFPGGVIASGILLLASFFVTGFITGFYRFPASEFFNLAWGLPTQPNSPDYQSEVYIKPYCRIGPYIIGLLLGAIFYYNIKPKFPKYLNWLFYLTLWAIAVAIGMSIVYGLYSGFQGREFSQAENILYSMFSHTGWGIALALLLYVCHYGYGGPINSFLSMPFWVPLSRLTFNAYLTHPIVMIAIFGSERDTMYYTDITMAVYIVACVVLSYGAAGVVSIVVEFPVANVEMAVFKVLGVQLRESTRRVKMYRDTKLPEKPVDT